MKDRKQIIDDIIKLLRLQGIFPTKAMVAVVVELYDSLLLKDTKDFTVGEIKDLVEKTIEQYPEQRKG